MSITLLRYTSLNSASKCASKICTRNRPMFCDVCGGTTRSTFHDFNMWLGAPKRRHTSKQATIARPILATPRLLGQFWKEERLPNLMTIDTLYNRTGLGRILRCQTVLTARSLATTRINMAWCSENVICRQTNDDSDTSVRDKYIAASILERQENDEFDDANHTR